MSLTDLYTNGDVGCNSPLNMTGVLSIVVLFCSCGLVWAYRNVRKVTSINLNDESDIDLDDQDSVSYDNVTPSQRKLLLDLGDKIAEVLMMIIQGAK